MQFVDLADIVPVLHPSWRPAKGELVGDVMVQMPRGGPRVGVEVWHVPKRVVGVPWRLTRTGVGEILGCGTEDTRGNSMTASDKVCEKYIFWYLARP